jgi:uncharacterized protein (DUF2147 family)
MKALGIAAVAVTLMSSTAFAGQVFEFNLGNGKTARIQLRDCGDRICAPSVSLRDGPSRVKNRRSDEPSYSQPEPEQSAPAASNATSAPPIPAPASVARAPAPVTSAPSIPQPSQAASTIPQSPPIAASIPPPPSSAPTIPAPAAAAPPVPPSPKVVMRAPANVENPFTGPATESKPAATSSAENPFAAPSAAPSIPAPTQASAGVIPSPEPQARVQPTPPARTAALPTPQPAAAAGPVGEWIVEDGVGRVRIEECGRALCGVVSSAKDPNDTDRKNPDPKKRKRPIIGMPVLLDMQPTRENRWQGEVYNVRDGQTYTANMSMRNPTTLRIEGCVMGGMFCGGQNWKRVQ